jgi:hypothetical protein
MAPTGKGEGVHHGPGLVQYVGRNVSPSAALCPEPFGKMQKNRDVIISVRLRIPRRPRTAQDRALEPVAAGQG